MIPTPYPELNGVLHELLLGARAVLGDAFTAAYLQGSFAVGDFDRDSDVDFVVVTEADLRPAHVEALNAMHERIYNLDCEWAKHLEGSYFPRAVLRSCDERGKPLWYLDHGSRSLILSTHCNTAVVRWILHERGVVLAGPDPSLLVDPVPVDTLRLETLATIRDWGREILTEPERYSNHFYQTFVVLSYCRMLYGLRTGRVESKRAGAEWAKVELGPSWAGLIDRAWDGRPNPAESVRRPADPGEMNRTLELVRHLISIASASNPPDGSTAATRDRA